RSRTGGRRCSSRRRRSRSFVGQVSIVSTISRSTMPTIQVEAHLSRRDLLKATEQLDPAEFQQFVADVLGLRAQRQAPRLSTGESDLLLVINRGLPDDLQRRYRELIAK